MSTRLIPALLSCLALSGAGCGEPLSRCGPEWARVTRVIDGDTVTLEDGTRVRYLLIDAPEISGEAECFGPESRAYNEALVFLRRVRLSYDLECTDRYGRLLAYLEVDGAEINLRLVRQGYACVLFIAPNGEKRRQEYLEAEMEARSLGRGMWGACEVVGCD